MFTNQDPVLNSKDFFEPRTPKTGIPESMITLAVACIDRGRSFEPEMLTILLVSVVRILKSIIEWNIFTCLLSVADVLKTLDELGISIISFLFASCYQTRDLILIE